jgi:hypothetical protein
VGAAQDELFGIDFFRLQLQFAQKVSALTGIPLAEAVGNYTNIYIRLAMGRVFDANNPDWQHYLAGLADAGDQAAWTHTVHLSRLHIPAGPVVEKRVGCFSCASIGQNRVRLHFQAVGNASTSPLSTELLDVRRHELRTLFSVLKASSSEQPMVVGASWLYNLRSYRRLFPESYLEALRAMPHPYQRMPLWGQLLTRYRDVRPRMMTSFVEKLAQASTLRELDQCFPFQVLAVTIPAQLFYDHFGL